MKRPILMDLLSELLMLTTAGMELYRVVGARAEEADRPEYAQFMAESSKLRDHLVEAITAVGGDPNYIAPVARVAQYKSEQLLSSALMVDGLLPEEVRISDLENTIVAADQALSHYKLLAAALGVGVVAKATRVISKKLSSVTGRESKVKEPDPALAPLGPVALEGIAANAMVVTWARRVWEAKNNRLLLEGPATLLEWPDSISNPINAIEEYCAEPITEHLLEGSQLVIWLESPLIVMGKETRQPG